MENQPVRPAEPEQPPPAAPEAPPAEAVTEPAAPAAPAPEAEPEVPPAAPVSEAGPEPAPPAAGAPRFSRPPDYWALWAVALISLALNGFFLYEQWALLNFVRAQAPLVDAAANQVREWRAATIEYQVRIDQVVPVVTNVVISQTVSVPISATLPVNTQVQIPISVAGFNQVLRVPVNATIPIELETKVPLNLTVPIRADVPVKADVPIKIEIGKTPADFALAGAETRLDELSEQLRQLELGQLLQRLTGGAP